MRTVCSYEARDETSWGSARQPQPGRLGHDPLASATHCVYCEARLSQHSLDELLTAPIAKLRSGLDKARNSTRFEPYTQFEHAFLELRNCVYCGWWLLRYTLSLIHHSWTSGIPISCGKALYGEVKHYDVSSLDAPLAALRAYLSKHPRHVAHVHPTQFELLMRACLSEYCGAAEVIHTGQSGDGGVDLKMILTDGDTYLVQVKRRSDTFRFEGVRVVRELNGVLFREGCAKGMVVTTAGGFSAAAKREAAVKTATIEKYEMRLVAFDDIVAMLRLNHPTPYEPWLTYVNDIDVSSSKQFLKSLYFGREQCGQCFGTGRIRTGGGCSLEHGISTTCEEYGCLPVTYGACSRCRGAGYIGETSLCP